MSFTCVSCSLTVYSQQKVKLHETGTCLFFAALAPVLLTAPGTRVDLRNHSLTVLGTIADLRACSSRDCIGPAPPAGKEIWRRPGWPQGEGKQREGASLLERPRRRLVFGCVLGRREFIGYVLVLLPTIF